MTPVRINRVWDKWGSDKRGFLVLTNGFKGKQGIQFHIQLITSFSLVDGKLCCKCAGVPHGCILDPENAKQSNYTTQVLADEARGGKSSWVLGRNYP